MSDSSAGFILPERFFIFCTAFRHSFWLSGCTGPLSVRLSRSLSHSSFAFKTSGLSKTASFSAASRVRFSSSFPVLILLLINISEEEEEGGVGGFLIFSLAFVSNSSKNSSEKSNIFSSKFSQNFSIFFQPNAKIFLIFFVK